jgi:hypothetical protein
VVSGRRIAGLRIHIERLIGRLRHYKIIDNGKPIETALLHYLDDAVIIVAALVNLQPRTFN